MVVVWWLPAFYYLSKATALALPQSFNSRSFPVNLTSLIPFCGQPCVAAAVSTAWPSNICGSTGNLPCLCTARSATGFTLGEILVQCLASSCSITTNQGNDTLLGRVYNVCANQPGNLPNTHATLTATAPQAISTVPSNRVRPSRRPDVQTSTVLSRSFRTSPSTVVSPSATTSSSRITSATISVVQSSSTTAESVTSSTSTTPQSTASSTTSPMSSTEPTATLSTPSQQVPSQTSSPTSNSRPPLKGVEIAAITIGSLVAVSILFSMIMICLRQRRKRRQSRGDISGFNILPSPLSVVGPSKIGQVGVGRVSDRSKGIVPGQATRPVPNTPVKKVRIQSDFPDVSPDEIGIAISPDLNQKNLPQTPRISSGSPSRSNSRLLPDRPVYQPVSPVLSSRPFSDATEFEEEGNSIYNSSSSATSVDWATAYYTGNVDPDEHLRGFQYARETGSLPAITRPSPVAGPRGWDTSRPKRLRTGGGQFTAGNELQRESIVQAFPRPPRGIRPLQTESLRNIPRIATGRPANLSNQAPEEAVSPISPENLRYPAIPRSLSTTPSFQVRGQPRPTRPSPPQRDDTYTRNEDLVNATTQALTEITGSANLLIEQAERDARLRQLHLNDEVERARRGIEVMRQRAATAAANIHRSQGMGHPLGPRPMVSGRTNH